MLVLDNPNKLVNWRINMEDQRNFFSRWFGFSGWKAMSTKTRISVQILYRIMFLAGLFVLIISYGVITKNDPNGVAIILMIGGWYLCFQFFINLIFVEGSR